MNKGLKWLFWIVVIVLAVWGLVSKKESSDRSSNTSDTIKVGALISLTGDAAVYGEPARNIYIKWQKKK